MTTRKLTTKAIAKSASTYIGKVGEIFYDTATATLKLSDGATAGGVSFVGGAASWPVTNTAGASGPTKIAIGANAGSISQGTFAVAVGILAGNDSQGSYATAIGPGAGGSTQGQDAVAVGYGAGNQHQGTSAVAIGKLAGETSQGNNSIILNATGSALNQTTASTFTVKPVRDGGAASGMSAAGFRPCYYNPTTGEFVYASM